MADEVIRRSGEIDVSTTPPMAYARRISWPALFAGLVVVLVVQIFLATVGISIGAGTINPTTENAPFQGLGMGAGIWLALSSLIALFAGGWVTGRVAHVLDRTDAALHGFLTWGLATLVTTYLMTTMVGGLVSGAAGVLGRSISALGQGASSVGSMVLREGEQFLDERGVTLGKIQAEATTLLRQTGKPELQPQNLAANAERAVREGKQAGAAALQNPQQGDADITALLDRLTTRADAVSSAADKDALVNIIVARTGMSRGQAEVTVNRWAQTLANARLKFEETRVVAEEKARQAGEKAAGTVAKTAGWSAFVMLLGALAASFGGVSSVPRDGENLTREKFHRPADVLS